MVEFGRHAAARRKRKGLDKPETFTFMEFVHICGRSRHGAFQFRRKTRSDRMRTTLRAIKKKLRARMHHSIPAQGLWLRSVLKGYFAYHAVPTNARAMAALRHHVMVLWRRTLRRLNQNDRLMWGRMAKIAADWLPQPRILNP